MERLIVPPQTETNLKKMIQGVMDGAAAIPTVLSQAPTTANQILKEGQRGYFNGKLYETINGVTYEYGSAV